MTAKITENISMIRRIGRKANQIAPLIARDPRLLPLMWQGVHPEIYNRLNVAWLRKSNFRTIIDVGANTGQFSLTVHALLPDATIYALEPQQECFDALNRSFEGSPNLHAIHTAVGDKDGEITFHRNFFSQSSSVLPMTELHKRAFPWARNSQEIQVPIHRLDSLRPKLELEPSILVKIDVQGFEDRVLRGGAQVIRQAEYVLIETAFEQLYEGEATFDAVHGIMTGYGFSYAGSLDQIANPATDLPLYADTLFIRR